jgi:branched-chain amino acid transport system ATP-binding protein
LADSVLALADVHAYYGKSHVLHGVTLEVGRGQVVALLGRNGVGKTTTVRAVLNLVGARRGRVVVNGQDVGGWATDAIVRLGVGYVPQGPKIFPSLSVAENLRVAASAIPGARTIEEILAEFPAMHDYLARPAGTLSGGQQQLVAIARSLAMNCRLLLLDEPTDGLMPKLVHEIGELIPRLAAKGIGILLVEQNLDLALAVSRRVYVMEKGQIRYEGSPEDFRREPLRVERYLGVAVT